MQFYPLLLIFRPRRSPQCHVSNQRQNPATFFYMSTYSRSKMFHLQYLCCLCASSVVRRSSCRWWKMFRPFHRRMLCGLCSSTVDMRGHYSSTSPKPSVYVTHSSSSAEIFFFFKAPEWKVALLRSNLVLVRAVFLSFTFSCVLLQKMLQSPYFFFDVVYLHNGVDEQSEETSWRVSGAQRFELCSVLQ